MRRSLLVVGFLSVLACAAADTSASAFKLSSLVLPQGVSYELGPVTLTRTLDAATSASKVGNSSSKTQEDSSSVRKTVGSGVESSRSSGRSSGSNLGGSIGGSSGGDGGFSLLGLLGVHVDVGGKVSTEDSNSDKSTNRNGTESTSESSRGSKSGSSSEFEEIEQYGQYHLKFSVRFKSKDLSDTFLVGGPNSRVILEGFSAPVPVPYTERTEPVRLRAEERVFFFDHPIADQVTLRDAKRMVAQGRRNAVTLSLIGDEFPVISERTKENVVSEITRIMKLSPNTLVAVDFGDVKRLSPWRVRRKFTKASGRKGERLTVRDALLALNGTIAEDEEMPDETFTFGRDGALAAVVDTPTIPAPRRGDVALVLVSVVENESDGASEAHFPTADFLKRPLSDFSEVRLVVGSLAELARAAVYVPNRVRTLRAEVESALPSTPAAESLWKELLVAARDNEKRYKEEMLRQEEARKEEEARKKREAEELRQVQLRKAVEERERIRIVSVLRQLKSAFDRTYGNYHGEEISLARAQYLFEQFDNMVRAIDSDGCGVSFCRCFSDFKDNLDGFNPKNRIKEWEKEVEEVDKSMKSQLASQDEIGKIISEGLFKKGGLFNNLLTSAMKNPVMVCPNNLKNSLAKLFAECRSKGMDVYSYSFILPDLRFAIGQ